MATQIFGAGATLRALLGGWPILAWAPRAFNGVGYVCRDARGLNFTDVVIHIGHVDINKCRQCFKYLAVIAGAVAVAFVIKHIKASACVGPLCVAVSGHIAMALFAVVTVKIGAFSDVVGAAIRCTG